MRTCLAAYLSYRDAPAALRWLQALGFELVRRADAEDGTVAHSELRCDDVVLMVSSYDADYSRPPLSVEPDRTRSLTSSPLEVLASGPFRRHEATRHGR